jgi:hypothetical protein
MPAIVLATRRSVLAAVAPFAILAVVTSACAAPGEAEVTAGAVVRTPGSALPPSILVIDSSTGLTAVSSVGARNVKLLLLRPPSIVLLREVFVPPGEVVVSVSLAPGPHPSLIVETETTRFALDSHTGQFSTLDAGRLASVSAHPRAQASVSPHRRR